MIAVRSESPSGETTFLPLPRHEHVNPDLRYIPGKSAGRARKPAAVDDVIKNTRPDSQVLARSRRTGRPTWRGVAAAGRKVVNPVCLPGGVLGDGQVYCRSRQTGSDRGSRTGQGETGRTVRRETHGGRGRVYRGIGD